MLEPEWAQLLDAVAAEYPLINRTEDWVCVGWPAQNPDQTIQVTCVRVQGLMRILIVADICPAADVSERDALELASKLLVGGIYIRKGVLAMRLVLTEGHYTMELVRSTIEILRKNAIRFRDELLRKKASVAGTFFDEDRF